MTILRVFPDTTIWIAALGRPEGGSGVIFTFAKENRIKIISSQSIFEEVRRNLYKLKKVTTENFENLVAEVTPEIIEISPNDLIPWKNVVHPKDEHVLASAKKGKSKILVSFDKAHILENKVLRESFKDGPFNAGEFIQWFLAFEKEQTTKLMKG